MKKILIVEDEILMRKTLVDGFKKAGFKIIEAENGQKGLDMALQDKPDLILLDVMMPVMSGLEMLEKLRADEEGKKIKVVILSNFNDYEKIADAVEKGAFTYLVKSDLAVQDIVIKVTQILE